MPVNRYGVLKGRPIGVKFAAGANDHYQIHLVDDTTDYRIAINVKSSERPPDLLYLVDENFTYPILNQLEQLPLGFKPLEHKPGGLALDFIRANLFNRAKMLPLPASLPGPDNDLNEKVDKFVQRALSEEESLIYAFGARWGPEDKKKDKYFGFLPGNGIHDIHMNQGNDPKHAGDDGVWQDGAMLIHFPSENQWVAVFLKFQSQAWHTDDKTGHAILTRETSAPVSPETSLPEEPAGKVRIVAALVNPVGADPEKETVTLLNMSSQDMNLTGWALADTLKNQHKLTGILKAGTTLVVALPPTIQLGNKGGIITLLDQQGLKVDGVSYTKQQARQEGWTIMF
jgi:uncharacterized protein YukJ